MNVLFLYLAPIDWNSCPSVWEEILDATPLFFCLSLEWMTLLRPTVFIGSSSEGLKIAEAIQLNLDHPCEATVWSQGIFGLSGGTLESLVARLDGFDFAVLVLTPDDLTISRGETNHSPRDNVLLELGLFIGALGPRRTFIVHERDKPLKLPSDLAGVTPATFMLHSDGNLQASLGAVTTLIKRSIQQSGRRHEKISADIATRPNSRLSMT